MRQVYLVLCLAFALRCGGDPFTADPNDLPDASGHDASGDGAALDAAEAASNDSGVEAAADSDADSGDAASDSSGDASDAALDATNGDATPDGATSDGGPGDGGDASPEAGADGCTPTTWYPDADKDGYGRTSGAVDACDPPSPDHVAAGGDCNDDNAQVHPGQMLYFDVPYTKPGGGNSFDYDCDGAEMGNPSQFGLAPSCNNPLNCTGQGFMPVNIGESNALCGSTTLRTCVFNLVCKAEGSTVQAGKGCR